MPLAYPGGTIEEHLACRQGAVAFDVSHLGTVRVEGAGALETLQAQLTNDLGKIGPGRAQYTHLLDPDDASVLDDIIVWWRRRRGLRRDAQRLQHRAGAGRDRGDDVTGERAIIAVQGPEARRRLEPVAPEAAAVGRFRVAPLHVERHGLHRRRHRLHGRGRGRDLRARGGRGRPLAGDPRRGRGAGGVGRPGHPPAGGRPPAARARAGPGHHPAAGRVGLGRVVDQADVPRARTRSRPNGSGACTGCCGASAPRGGDRRERSARCASTAPRRGRPPAGTSRPSSATASRSPSCRPTVEEGTAVEVDLRGSALAGSVVSTPFVRKA